MMKRKILWTLCSLLLLTLLPMQVFAEAVETTVEAQDEAMLATVYEPNDTMETAAFLKYNNVYFGELSENDFVDFFRFTVNSTQEVTINVDVEYKDTYVYLLDEEGTWLWGEDVFFLNNTTPEICIRRTMEPGTYYFRMDYSKPEVNPYTLTLTQSNYTASCNHVSSVSGVMVYTLDPTCIQSGYKLRTCMTCGHQWKTDITEPSHSLSDWTVTKEASCTETGTRTAICFRCGESVVEEIPATGHAFTELVLEDAPTKEYIGWQRGTCSVCQKSISDSIPSLGSSFSGTYTVPDGFTTIGASAFANGEDFTRIILPDSVTQIMGSAFSGCTNLTSVSLPGRLVCLGQNAFQNCTALNGISLPGSLKQIENGTFYDCTGLASVSLPYSLTHIGDNAFYGCSSLSAITIPSDVTSIGYGAFSGCEKLYTVTISDLAAWCRIDFANASANPLSHAISFKLNSQYLNDLVIPEGVTIIRPYAFAGYRMLGDVTIPDSVTELGYCAFYESGISSVSVGNGVSYIDDDTFQDCTSLETVTLGSGIQEIGYEAFEGCEKLREIVFPEGLAEIDSYAFKGCGSLTELTFPASLTEFGHTVFSGCTSLKKVFFLGDVPSFDSWWGSPFPSATTTGYYPAANATWTETARSEFGSGIKWNPCDHDFSNASCRYKSYCRNCYADGWYVHSYADATCSAPETCTDCGSIRGKALPHTETPVPGYPASCTQEGMTDGSVCTVCNAVTVAQEVIPLLPHTEQILEKVPATCTENGLTEGKQCSVCGTVLEKQGTIFAYGHLEVELYARSASCTKDGLTEGTKCYRCEKILVPQQTIPALGHTYTDDRDADCDVCGEEREIIIKSVPMFRMYDPNSGEHFYTGAEAERDFLVNAGWHYEGVGFNFPEEGAPVFRLYDPQYGEHLYTMDEAEKTKLLDAGWNDEGVAFNSAPDDQVPQYRLHNPNAKRGGYHFTGSIEERDLLISFGWILQDIGWYSCLE